jgi:hypothetical protein
LRFAPQTPIGAENKLKNEFVYSMKLSFESLKRQLFYFRQMVFLGGNLDRDRKFLYNKKIMKSGKKRFSPEGE